MRIAVTTSYDLEDIPADLAEASIRWKVPVTVESCWDHGTYCLRLISGADQVDWPSALSVAEITEHPDFQIFSNAWFDGSWNLDSLSADEEVAKELLFQYAEHQRLLYPGLTVTISEAEE